MFAHFNRFMNLCYASQPWLLTAYLRDDSVVHSIDARNFCYLGVEEAQSKSVDTWRRGEASGSTGHACTDSAPVVVSTDGVKSMRHLKAVKVQIRAINKGAVILFLCFLKSLGTETKMRRSFRE